MGFVYVRDMSDLTVSQIVSGAQILSLGRAASGTDKSWFRDDKGRSSESGPQRLAGAFAVLERVLPFVRARPSGARIASRPLAIVPSRHGGSVGERAGHVANRLWRLCAGPGLVDP